MKTCAHLISKILIIKFLALAQSPSAFSFECNKKDSLGDIRYDSSAVIEAISAFNLQQNTFAWDLYRELALKEGNIAISPFSISQTVAMAMIGADGSTKDGMMNILAPTGSTSENLHFAFSMMLSSINDRENRAYELKTANSIWGQKHLVIKTPFQSILSTYYDTEITQLDFMSEPESSRIEINQWVYEATNKTISDLIPEGAVNDMTRLVLTDAIFYKGSWLYPFDKKKTKLGIFNGKNHSIETPMMHLSQSLMHRQTDVYQAIQLPIIAKDGIAESEQIFGMILPADQKSLYDVEKEIDEYLISDIINQSNRKTVDLSIPKFKFTAPQNLKEPLSSLGMKEAFDRSLANFSNLYESDEEIFITDAFHKGFIDVHEEGLEAAGATALVAGCTSIDTEKVAFTADKPFIFFIFDRPSNTVLFLGRYENI